MEAIATDFAVDITKGLITMVASKAFEEIMLIWGFNNNLGELKEKFEDILALLRDVGIRKNEIKIEYVNRWLQKVKELAYSTENLLSDHAYEMLRRKLEFINSNNNRRPSFKKKWRSYMREPLKSPIAFRFQMTYRVNKIMSMFDELYNKAKEMGLNPAKLAKEAAAETLAPPSAADQELSQIRKRPPTQLFVGRVNEKKKLLELIKNIGDANQDTNTSIPVIAIVGLGGLGKTTLARKLFDGEDDDWHFDGEKVWICVSENFNCLDILKEMVESVTGKGSKVDRNADTIIKKLEDNLKGKKLFLVLDDVWNDNRNLWDSLKGDLNRIGVATGSVILITTRNKDVATAAGVGASRSHDLKGLSDNDAMELLKRQFPENSYFNEAAAIKIINKCAGVPLAIKVIGGILESMDPSEWYQIEKSEEWNIPQDVNNTIMPYLLLTYNHFNDVSLKQCFACCAIYPKDTVMKKGELIALWSAQGLLHHHDQDKSNSTSTTTMETIGSIF